MTTSSGAATQAAAAVSERASAGCELAPASRGGARSAKLRSSIGFLPQGASQAVYAGVGLTPQLDSAAGEAEPRARSRDRRAARISAFPAARSSQSSLRGKPAGFAVFLREPGSRALRLPAGTARTRRERCGPLTSCFPSSAPIPTPYRYAWWPEPLDTSRVLVLDEGARLVEHRVAGLQQPDIHSPGPRRRRRASPAQG